MELDVLKVFRVDFHFYFLESKLEFLEPRVIKLGVKLRNDHRGNILLKLSFGALKLS